MGKQNQTTIQKGGLSANALKTIAILAMVIDHYAAGFMIATQPLTILMRGIGRITAPIMFYFLVEGYHKTRNINKYTLRMFLFAAISYVPFIYYFDGAMPNVTNFMHFNVIYTLFMALLALRARHEIKNKVVQWGIIGALVFLSLSADWSFMAILYVLLFDSFYGDFEKQSFAYCMVTIFYIAPYFKPLLYSMGYEYYTLDMNTFKQSLLYLGMFLPIMLLRFYNGEKGKGGKMFSWFFYLFYPVHLIVLAMIRNARYL